MPLSVPTNLQQFALMIALQCCDIFKKREIDIFQCFDHLEPRAPAEEKVDLLSRDPSVQATAKKDFLVRAYTDWIIKKYAAALDLKTLEVINRVQYAFTEKSDEGKKVLQYSVNGGAVAVSRQLLRQTILCRAMAGTDEEKTDMPILQTRIWPASYLKNLQEYKLIKDKNHPSHLMHFTYGLVRDFIHNTYNYSHLFEEKDGELVIDVLARDCRFNGERLEENLRVASKMFKHFFNAGVTRGVDEISRIFDQKTEERERRLIKDDIHTAELTARIKTCIVRTPDENRRMISVFPTRGLEILNIRSVQQTMEVLATVRTETDEYQVPFTQIRLWPDPLTHPSERGIDS